MNTFIIHDIFSDKKCGTYALYAWLLNKRVQIFLSTIPNIYNTNKIFSVVARTGLVLDSLLSQHAVKCLVLRVFLLTIVYSTAETLSCPHNSGDCRGLVDFSVMASYGLQVRL